MIVSQNCTANIIRAIEVDKQLKAELTDRAPHVLTDTICVAVVKLYEQLSAYHDTFLSEWDEGSSTHTTDSLDDPREVLKAWKEVTATLEETRNDRDMSIDEIRTEHRKRLWQYPIHVSVDGAVTLSVPIPNANGLSQPTLDILQELAFFHPSDSPTSDDSMMLLHLPLLLIKNAPRYQDKKSNRKSFIATKNEQRIVTASAAWFLARLGIMDFPIFGLVTSTDGKKGHLSQAWFSEKDKVRSSVTI